MTFRRRVLYIPGYDPFHPRRYRELYRREGAEQARLSGYQIEQRRGPTPYSWDVESVQDGAHVHAQVEVLVWSDIVSRSMARSIPATYAQLVRTAWAYVASGALARLMRLRKGPVIAALYPIVALLLQAVIAVGAGVLAAWAVPQVLPQAPHLALAGGIGVAVAWALLRLFQRADRKTFTHYLMHDYAFTAHWGGAYPVVLEARLAAFRETIRAALDGDWDEVLVVGHSSGAHLGISVLADLLRDGVEPEGRLSFLSLGQVVPMVSFLPGADRLRADLEVMGGQAAIPWIDVTAPGDGCAFALCDPVAVSGLAPERQTGPLVISAAFTKTLSDAKQRELRRRYFRLHFQYLCAFDALPGQEDDYDYFRITAGPRTLGDRFAARAPSPSRLTAPVNRHTSTAAPRAAVAAE
ncbi:hypothetical protein JQC91_09505 [Jannaschia sp. Os4]|uniref:hypothetical protein n=1 Tax=Jannaschia sp. Os4 TaxID=2807617 RepID=UPI0019395AF2|nr:hypothetical protein [Jannaschia sp. Os4]MBM2576543.1 hypothetical protein [Jannaschia sp. Os4]